MSRNSGSMAFVLFLGIVAGLALIVGPFFVPALPDASRIVLLGFGVALLLVFTVLIVITRLYRKTAADEAFVRTGVGGRKCIIDGGAIVIPVVHEVIPVSLKTFKLDVDRTGGEALITADFLRADVKAVFYVRVQKEPQDIVQAATSLGMSSGNPQAVQQLIFEKLVSALRTVAATQKLYDLNAKRAEFAEAVQRIVEQDLKSNGLTLESVTISSLDQAPVQAMRIGALGIGTFPGEAFVELGLNLKAKSPFKPTLLVELANDYRGYIPTLRGFEEGGYETWRAKSSYLEKEAAAKMTASLLRQLGTLAA